MIGKVFYYIKKLIYRSIKKYERTLFKTIGTNVYFGNNCTFTYKTISLGDHVYIGNNCVVQSTHGQIKIGNHVMFGPGVNVHGGNHVVSKVGVYMDQVEKNYGDDPDIVKDDDVWIGANAIILPGVHINKGAVIGAGTIIVRDVPAYSIVVGNPGKVIKMRFDDQTIIEHEKKLMAEK